MKKEIKEYLLSMLEEEKAAYYEALLLIDEKALRVRVRHFYETIDLWFQGMISDADFEDRTKDRLMDYRIEDPSAFPERPQVAKTLVEEDVFVRRSASYIFNLLSSRLRREPMGGDDLPVVRWSALTEHVREKLSPLGYGPSGLSSHVPGMDIA